MDIHIVPSLNPQQSEERKRKILAMLSRGSIVAFIMGDIYKCIREWKEDNDDLKCFFSNGRSEYVCWNSPHYQIVEVTDWDKFVAEQSIHF
jgi:hypothetical protein